MARRSRRMRSADSAQSQSSLRQLAWQQPENPYQLISVLSDDQIEAIHEASLKILEEIGIAFLLEEARAILKKAGADVCESDDVVRMDRAMVLEAISHAPSSFNIHARNPAHTIRIGGRYSAFALVGSPPNVSDLEGGRRRGNCKDFCDLIRLGQFFNAIHIIGGYPVEPIDLPPATRHLDALRHTAILSDKVFHAYSLGKKRNHDGLEIARIARGIDEAQMLREPSLLTIINTSSPLRLDRPMLRGIIEMARRNQVTVITPFTLSGAMAPVTIAGALAQQNAEALAGIAFAQLVKPGAPVIYGGFTSNVDMRTGAPAFGTPEYAQATLASGQLARRYQLPFRTSNVNASNAPDGQSVWESMMSLWSALMGGGHFIKHAAGWIEGGLCASFEKLVIDVELLQMMTRFLEPFKVDEATLGLDAIAEVGQGGHFFGAAHTMARYRTAFYEPILADWQNFENWSDAGAMDATVRAHKLYKDALAEYQQPAMDPAIREELDAFVERRKREGGADEE